MGTADTCGAAVWARRCLREVGRDISLSEGGITALQLTAAGFWEMFFLPQDSRKCSVQHPGWPQVWRHGRGYSSCSTQVSPFVVQPGPEVATGPSQPHKPFWRLQHVPRSHTMCESWEQVLHPCPRKQIPPSCSQQQFTSLAACCGLCYVQRTLLCLRSVAVLDAIPLHALCKKKNWI